MLAGMAAQENGSEMFPQGNPNARIWAGTSKDFG